MMRRIPVRPIVWLVFGFAAAAVAEDITVTTYYPSPRGVYEELRTTGNTYVATQGGSVGVGTTTPGAKLEVNGQAKITGGSPGNNKVLASDATGLGSWQALTTLGAVLGSGTTNHVAKWTSGTAIGDSQIFDNGANVGVGTTTPGAKLEVSGQVRITGGAPGAGKVLSSDGAGTGSWSTLTSLGAVTGSGTTNRVPLWTSSNNLGDSQVFQSGGSIGIGVGPTNTLDVNGSIRIRGGGPGDNKVLTSDGSGNSSWDYPRYAP